MTYAQEQRQRMIDFLVFHYGALNRAALIDYFDISTPQASLDIAAYVKRAPGNLVYDKSTKQYRRGPEFKRLYP